MCLKIDKSVVRSRTGYVYKGLTGDGFLYNIFRPSLPVAKILDGIWYSSCYEQVDAAYYRDDRYDEVNMRVFTGFHGLYCEDGQEYFVSNFHLNLVCIKVHIVGAYRVGRWLGNKFHQPIGFSCLRYRPVSFITPVTGPIKIVLDEEFYTIYKDGAFLPRPEKIPSVVEYKIAPTFEVSNVFNP